MTANAEMIEYWNGPVGERWARLQETIDASLSEIQKAVMAFANPRPRERVLDIGCGAGTTSYALARAVGLEGNVTGVDISEPMLAVARARGRGVNFRKADAATHLFHATHDLVFSRFGVMFFNDPVRAFANFRRASTDRARLRLVVWRGPAENPFMTTAERAAAPLVPGLPTRRPDEPGQFAFADPDRVRGILTEGGWAGIDLRPVDVECVFPESALLRYLTRLGPVSQVLGELDEDRRKQVVETVRAAFDPFVEGEHVRFTAACWDVDARASSDARARKFR